MSIFKNILLLVQSVYIVSSEYIKYKLWINNHVTAFRNVTDRLSELNMLYTKILQWITNENILENKEIKDILKTYSDNVKYNELDIDYLSLIKLLNNKDIKLVSLEPIKSGTVSLIYKGLLNDQEIAIKVMRNNIRERLVESIEYFIFLGKICRYIPYIKEFNIDSMIKDNKEKIMSQLDFKKEIYNIETFYENFKENNNIIVPKVYKNYSIDNENIIIMDYIEGNSVYLIDNDDKIIYIKMLYEFIFESILNYRIIHGDLHPGNILFRKKDNKYELGIIDYGIIDEFTEEEQQSITIFFKRLVLQKFDLLFEYILDTLVVSTNNTDDISNLPKKEIINKLLIAQNKYEILKKKVKAKDIYYINEVLKNYDLKLSLGFSKVFLFLGSMYSLLHILQEKISGEIFEESFKEYASKHFFVYLNFIE
jgi:predicted unusual protein kinase regulating ubiquinone biosynthesis (AarF/ABC1/UbiB family)